MSYLSLLFSSVAQAMANDSTARPESKPEAVSIRNIAESAWNGSRSMPGDYLLPAGIASLDHWLDLNA